MITGQAIRLKRLTTTNAKPSKINSEGIHLAYSPKSATPVV